MDKKRKNSHMGGPTLFTSIGQAALSSNGSVSSISSVSTSFTGLPSLSVTNSKFDYGEMDSIGFASTLPVFHRGRYDVFGVGGKRFNFVLQP